MGTFVDCTWRFEQLLLLSERVHYKYCCKPVTGRNFNF